MEKNKILIGTIIILLLSLIIKLLIHSSQNPFIFNQYSVFYFLNLLVIIPFLLGMVFVLFRFGLKGARVIIINGLLILGIIVLIEVLGQFYAWLNPSYKTLLLYPSEKFGWTFPPGLEFKYTSKHWFAREYSAVNKINSLGFRDLERSFKKDKNVIRIALLGASIVAGKESDFKNTIGQILERKLNAQIGAKLQKKFEVLNFGVDGYGMSQPLIIYQETVRKFDPDFLILYVGDELHLWKNFNPKLCWVAAYLIDDQTENKLKNPCFTIRPVLWFNQSLIYTKSSFRELDHLFFLKEFHEFILKLEKYKDYQKEKYLELVDDYKSLNKKIPDFIKLDILKEVSQRLHIKNLFFLPPVEFKKFSNSRKEIKEKIFKNKEFVKRKPKLFVQSYYKSLDHNLAIFQEKYQSLKYSKEFEHLRYKYLPSDPNKPELGNSNYPGFEHAILLGLKILQNFDRFAKKDGGKFAIVDALTFHTSRNSPLTATIVSDTLKKFSLIQNFGYITSGSDMKLIRQQGGKVRWNYDPHLNKLGNKTVAEGIYKWIEGEIEEKND
jgi:hypothetical protein